MQGRVHVVVAGQMPPPVGGQNLNVKRVHDLLSREADLKVSHLKFEFTRDWRTARRAGFHKVFELFRVMWRALRIRAAARVDCLIYPAGGPHLAPILRDLALLPVLWLLADRVVIHFRAAGMAEHLDGAPRWFKTVCRLIYGHTASDAIVLTDFGRRDPAALGIEVVRVVPNAYEDVAQGVTFRPTLPISTVLSVGHLCADKGTPELVRAFGKISRQSPGIWRLLLVGEVLPPYDDDALARDIKNSGAADRVQVLGLLSGSELARAYQEADLFVFGSVAPYESFGMVMIEAMQWSLPLVVTDWRGNTAVVGSNFGGVIAEEPSRDLTQSLETALASAIASREHWTAWGRTNRSIYEARYTIEHLRRNLRSVIDRKVPVVPKRDTISAAGS